MAFQLRVRITLPRAQCPECLGTHVRPRHANSYLDGQFAWILLPLTMRRVFVCEDCDCHFWDFAFKPPYRRHARRWRGMGFDSQADLL